MKRFGTATQTDELDLTTKNRNTMKSLIRKMSFAICTLLLTCTFCLAQDFEIIKYNNKPILTVSSDSTKVNVSGAELVTVKLLIEYETECKKDTTYSYGNCVLYFEAPKLGKQENGDIIEKYGNYWIVKKAIIKEPTFSDFVRWAAKKYGL